MPEKGLTTFYRFEDPVCRFLPFKGCFLFSVKRAKSDIFQVKNCDLQQILSDRGLTFSSPHRPPSFAKATDGRPSGMPCVDFFCASKKSGVQRRVRRMPRRRGASAPEAGQCGTDLQQTHSAAVLSIENDIASQKRVFCIVSLQILCL